MIFLVIFDCIYIYIHVAGARCPNKQTCTNYNSSTTEGTCTTSIAKQQLFGYLAAKKHIKEFQEYDAKTYQSNIMAQ